MEVMQQLDLVFLDLETTGIDPKQDKIIEVAAVARYRNGKREVFQRLVQPEVAVPPFITGLTGIDEEMLAEAPTFAQIRRELLAFLEGKILVAHNAAFDLAFLEAAFAMNLENLSVDTLEFCRLLYPGLNSYALRHLAREFSLPVENSHRALPDTLLLESLFLRLVKTASELSLQELQDTECFLQDSHQGMAYLLQKILQEKTKNYDFTAAHDLPPVPQAGTLHAAGSLKREIRWDLAEIEKMFLPGGMIARGLNIYQERKQQVKMTKAVGKAFQQQRHLLIEAGTGVGKSLAYLVPAVCWALSREEKVVISTHTIALQEQLLRSEIEFLRQVFDVSFKATVLKGRSNYICLAKWKNQTNNRSAISWPLKLFLARISLWLRQEKSGDRDRINLREWEAEIYQQLCSTSESCLGQSCRFFRECFYQKARQKALDADVIIVNHSLLLADLKMGETILPPYRQLVIDEAHHLEEEGTKLFSRVFSLRELQKRLSQLQRKDIAASGNTLSYWKKYFSELVSVNEQKGQVMLERLRETGKIIKKMLEIIEEIKRYYLVAEMPETIRVNKNRDDQWFTTLSLLYDNLMFETTGLLDNLKAMCDFAGASDEQEESLVPLRVLRTLYGQVKEDYDVLKEFFAKDLQAPEKVLWLEKDSLHGDLRFYISPLKISEILNQILFTVKSSIVLTSATLSVEDDFSYLISQLGIPEELADTLQLPSPFYYDEQALLLIDSSLPDPAKTSEEAYNLAVAEALQQYIFVRGGNTLVLFTSHKQMRYMYERLCEPLRQKGLDLFADGVNGRRHTLVNEMKNNQQAVVFGANTFWEGIDLPGESLTSLVIVKLPFSPPTFPMVEARLEELQRQGKNGFYHYSLPLAVLKFRQGYGRLIRSVNDNGVIIVLDNRLLTKRYGKVFINSLPNNKYYAGDMDSLVKRMVEWSKKW